MQADFLSLATNAQHSHKGNPNSLYNIDATICNNLVAHSTPMSEPEVRCQYRQWRNVTTEPVNTEQLLALLWHAVAWSAGSSQFYNYATDWVKGGWGGREEVERQARWGLGVSKSRGILAGFYMSRKTIQQVLIR